MKSASDEAVNIKNQLQEWTQSHALGTPTYRVIAGQGRIHERRYSAEVIVDHEVRGVGEGRTKKAAETQAAHHAFEWFQDQAAQPAPENDAASTCSVELD